MSQHTVVIETPKTQVVEIDEQTIVVAEQFRTETIEIGVVGPQGIKGDKGDSADQAFQYVHDQGLASTSWHINHMLNGFPNVTVVDSGGTNIEGEVIYVDSNNITLNFSAPFGGKAYLS